MKSCAQEHRRAEAGPRGWDLGEEGAHAELASDRQVVLVDDEQGHGALHAALRGHVQRHAVRPAHGHGGHRHYKGEGAYEEYIQGDTSPGEPGLS